MSADPLTSPSFNINDTSETLYMAHEHKYVIKFTSINDFDGKWGFKLTFTNIYT